MGRWSRCCLRRWRIVARLVARARGVMFGRPVLCAVWDAVWGAGACFSIAGVYAGLMGCVVLLRRPGLKEAGTNVRALFCQLSRVGNLRFKAVRVHRPRLDRSHIRRQTLALRPSWTRRGQRAWKTPKRLASVLNNNATTRAMHPYVRA